MSSASVDTRRAAFLADVARISYGKAKPPGTGPIPVFGSGGRYDMTAQALATANAVIVGRKGSAGSVWWPREPSWPSDTTFYVEPDVTKVDTAFLYYLLLANPLSGEHAQTTVPSLQKPDLAGVQILLLPLSEQRRTVRILSAIEQAMIASRFRIESLRRVSRALARQFDPSWPAVALGTAARIGNGSTPKRDRTEYWHKGTYPWLTSAKVYDDTILTANEFVTEAALAECHLPRVPSGSVVIAITGQGRTLGNVALLAIEATISQHLAYITPDRSRLDPAFLKAFLATRYDDFRSVALAGGSTKGALTCAFLRTYPVPIPSMEDQHRVVELLAAVSGASQAELAVADAQRRLFHSALTNLVGSAA